MFVLLFRFYSVCVKRIGFKLQVGSKGTLPSTEKKVAFLSMEIVFLNYKESSYKQKSTFGLFSLHWHCNLGYIVPAENFFFTLLMLFYHYH